MSRRSVTCATEFSIFETNAFMSVGVSYASASILLMAMTSDLRLEASMSPSYAVCQDSRGISGLEHAQDGLLSPAASSLRFDFR